MLILLLLISQLSSGQVQTSPKGSYQILTVQNDSLGVQEIWLVDSKHPEARTILYVTMGQAWAFPSPNEEFIAINDSPFSGRLSLHLFIRDYGMYYRRFANANIDEKVWRACTADWKQPERTDDFGERFVRFIAWTPDSRGFKLRLSGHGSRANQMPDYDLYFDAQLYTVTRQ